MNRPLPTVEEVKDLVRKLMEVDGPLGTRSSKLREQLELLSIRGAEVLKALGFQHIEDYDEVFCTLLEELGEHSVTGKWPVQNRKARGK